MYFFTVNLAERKQFLLTVQIDTLREAFRNVKQAHPFQMDAVVILPDHLHCIWKLPDGDDDFSLRWRQIKAAFSRAIIKDERISASRAQKKEPGLWQRRNWEHLIRDEADYRAHLDYIHFNPVKHGWAKQVKDWPYSTFRHWVRQGVYSLDWGGCAEDLYDE